MLTGVEGGVREEGPGWAPRVGKHQSPPSQNSDSKSGLCCRPPASGVGSSTCLWAWKEKGYVKFRTCVCNVHGVCVVYTMSMCGVHCSCIVCVYLECGVHCACVCMLCV
jgi:hypothetical protein